MLRREDFEWDDYWWKTRAFLPEWRGYLAQSFLYRRPGDDEPSDGMVDLIFAPEGRGDAQLDEGELRLVQWFVDNHELVSESALASIANAYPTLRAGYGYSPAELAEFAPVLDDRAGLRSLIGLHTVHVHNVQLGDLPFVGLEFVCTWDDEHGLGLMMHGQRVVRLGGADAAILRWIAERDASAHQA